MKEPQFVEDVIVPIISIPDNDPDSFRFLGSGFIIDQKGHLVTCKHVIEAKAENEKLFAYQYSTNKYLKIGNTLAV